MNNRLKIQWNARKKYSNQGTPKHTFNSANIKHTTITSVNLITSPFHVETSRKKTESKFGLQWSKIS